MLQAAASKHVPGKGVWLQPYHQQPSLDPLTCLAFSISCSGVKGNAAPEAGVPGSTAGCTGGGTLAAAAAGACAQPSGAAISVCNEVARLPRCQSSRLCGGKRVWPASRPTSVVAAATTRQARCLAAAIAAGRLQDAARLPAPAWERGATGVSAACMFWGWLAVNKRRKWGWFDHSGLRLPKRHVDVQRSPPPAQRSGSAARLRSQRPLCCSRLLHWPDEQICMGLTRASV